MNVLFLRDGNLMAQAFDEARLETSGSPRLVAERVDAYRDGATVSTSENGVLVYRGIASLQLNWLDRQGRPMGRIQEQGLYLTLTLSPDEKRALVSKASSQVASVGEIWLFDFERETSTRFTPTDSESAVWSPDASRVIFEVDGGLYERPAGSTPQQEVSRLSDDVNTAGLSLTSWSPDGRFVMYSQRDPKTSSDLWTLSLEGARTVTPFLRSEAAESQGQFSPNSQRGMWVAYTSNESGRDEVFVRTFPDGGNRQMVSRGGGHSPRWRGDGRELFYVSADGVVVATAFTDRGLGTPTSLFRVPAGFASRDATGSRAPAPWSVTPDGLRFLFAVPVEPAGVSQFTVVLNWPASLSR